MPASQATPIFSSPSTKKRHSSPLLNKVKSDGIAKKTRKPALSPQRPPVTRPDRNPRRHIPKHGFKPFCLVKCMRLKGNLMQSLLEAMAEPEQMEEVVYQHDKTCPCALCCGPRPMDTREEYEWDYPGFGGYLLEEYAKKVGQFPEMRLRPKNCHLYNPDNPLDPEGIE